MEETASFKKLSNFSVTSCCPKSTIILIAELLPASAPHGRPQPVKFDHIYCCFVFNSRTTFDLLQSMPALLISIHGSDQSPPIKVDGSLEHVAMDPRRVSLHWRTLSLESRSLPVSETGRPYSWNNVSTCVLSLTRSAIIALRRGATDTTTNIILPLTRGTATPESSPRMGQ
jgi:hypothetical protein